MTTQMISNVQETVAKIHEEIIDGRKVIIAHHKLTCDKSEKPYYILLEWYCGYVQILSKDNIYPSVQDYAREGGKNDPDVDLSSAPITYAGYLPQRLWDKNEDYFVGFSTNHYQTQNYDSEDVLRICKNVIKEQDKINKQEFDLLTNL